MAYRYRRRDPETGAMELYEDAGRSIPVNFGGMNLTGTPNLDYLQNLTNLAQQQQGPQLSPDEFGSYSIPASDPTYSSGFDYARSIAGGMPMSQVIAPGVSYSPEQPMGYTQEQLNTAVGTTPVEPPQGTPSPYGVFADDPSYFGTGIGGVTMFDDKDPKAIEHRDIITGKIIGGPLLPPRSDDFMSIDGYGGVPVGTDLREAGFLNMPEIIFDGPTVSMEEAEASLRAAGGGRGGRRGPIPPKRDDFMSIGGPGGGLPDPRTNTNIQTRDTEFGPVTISSPGGVSYLGGSPTFNEQVSGVAGNAFNQDFINKYQGTNDRPTPRLSIGGVGGGLLDSLPLQPPTDDPFLRPRVDAIGGQQPIPQVPLGPLPVGGNQQGMRFDPITRKMVPAEGTDMAGAGARPDLPPINIMNLPPVNLPPVIEMPPMRNVGRPNQDRFSIQQLPRGLFL